jgi:Ni/Fe-hydrogenase subunit HybB-like protein
MESTLSSRAFGRQREDRMLGSLSGAIVFVLLIYLAVRFVDLALRGRAGLMFSSGLYSVMFWLENVFFLVPALMLMSRRARTRISTMFRAACLIVLGGTLYRFDAYLVAFRPSEGWSYFPSIPEVAITVGLIALEILVFILLVKSFPILSGTRSPRAATSAANR